MLQRLRFLLLLSMALTVLSATPQSFFAPLFAEEPAASKDGTAPAPTPEQVKFFETEIRPLLANNCYKCHGEEKQNGGLRVDSLGALLAGGDSGPSIAPGAPDESLLIEAINYESFEMPPTGKLDEPARAALTRWIEMGAPWPGDAGVAVRTEATAKITEEDRAWWAFQPVREPEVPMSDDGGWARNPVDHFILQKLKQNNLTPSDEADRVTLIRRASFDLTGLPPSQEEIAAFLADASPQAYEAMIDRLLDSPRYGEHWGRYWLDLVRYAESDGYRQDAYRKNAWRYRDYVIRSFNADKPYDQFVREQLAGDEIAPHDPDALAATGYLRAWVYEYNQRDVRTQWSTILNDVTDVTGDVFLGMGVGCARCHDHKFDPILQEDYYRLQAFFTPLLPRDDQLLLNTEERRNYEEKLAAWETMTADVRAELDAFLRPYRESAVRSIIGMFTKDIQEMVYKPAAERAPLEHQLAELAYRQVDTEGGGVEARIKGDARKKYDELKAKLAAFDAHKPTPPMGLGVCDVGLAAPETTIPGDRQKRDIPPGFLTLLDPEPAQITPPDGLASTGRRTALAEWINREDNPLTHRVIVNRLWQYHFGQGLVATASDFGHLGEPPSHPELLDWLVVQFLNNGRQFKPMHRLLMTSATYRQLATRPASEVAKRVDPANRLWWRMNIRRLRAEQVRDAMLASTGELDLTAGGEGVDHAQPRRSVYLKVLRNTPESLLEAFDVADGFNSTAQRATTTTANQALLLFNGPWMLARAKSLKTRLEREGAQDDRAFIDAAMRHTLGRTPTTSELEAATDFLQKQAQRVKPAAPTLAADAPTGAMPQREGQAADLAGNGKRSRLAVPANSELPADDFTIEAFVMLRSLYEDASVRVIASQWTGDNNQPGWSLGVTSKKSKYRPQNLILQLVGAAPDQPPKYEVIASNIHLELNKPYYVAASIKTGGDAERAASFYVKDLDASETELQSARVPFQVNGSHRSQAALVLGGRDGRQASDWDGLVDDVRLSAGALSPGQLLINATARLDTTVGLWRFENQPGFYADESGRGNNLQTVQAASSPNALQPHDAARIDFCHILLNANEFLYVE